MYLLPAIARCITATNFALVVFWRITATQQRPSKLLALLDTFINKQPFFFIGENDDVKLRKERGGRGVGGGSEKQEVLFLSPEKSGIIRFAHPGQRANGSCCCCAILTFLEFSYKIDSPQTDSKIEACFVMFYYYRAFTLVSYYALPVGSVYFSVFP